MRSTCWCMVLAAGVALSAQGQLSNETSWKFDGAGNWVTKVNGSGPAMLFRKDDAKFAVPAGTTIPASGSSGRAAHDPDGSTDALDAFGTCSSFGLPLLGGVNRVVYQTAGTINGGVQDRGLGLGFWTNDALAGNDTSNWTFGWDFLIPTTITGPAAIPVFNDTEREGNDADAWLIVNADSTLSFHYRQGDSPTALGVSTGQWFRLVMVRDADGTNTVYVNGSSVGTTGSDTMWDKLPADLSTRADLLPYWAGWDNTPNIWFSPTLRAGCTWFGDNDGVNGYSSDPYSGAPIYVGNAFFALGSVCPAAISAWGGPSAAGFPVNNGSICSSAPGVTLTANPIYVKAGQSVKLLATAVAGTGPTSTSLAVTVDLSAFGLSATETMYDDGTHGDAVANDKVFTTTLNVPAGQAPQVYDVTATVTDNLARSSTGAYSLGIDDSKVGTYATQWDFNWDGVDPSTKLAPTFGPAVMAFWDRPGSGVAGSTEAATKFGTCSSFGIPKIDGVDAKVMKAAQYFGDQGIQIDDNMPGNAGGIWVNDYTFVYDIYVDPSAIAGAAPDASSGWWMALFNTNNTNSNDADAYVHLTDGTGAYVGKIGQSEVGGYTPANTFQTGKWYRMTWAMACGRGESPTCAIYLDGTEVFRSTFSDFDGQMPLYSTTDGTPGESRLHMFTEPTGLYTTECYLNSIYIVDRTLTADEIAGLGGAKASGVICPADFNMDGFADIYDFTDFVTCFEGGACPGGRTADFNNDGFADVYDFTDFVTAFETGC